jgi:hypothetical protein
VTRVLNGAPDSAKESPHDHLRWLISAHIALTETMLPWFVFAFMEAKSFPPAGRKMAVESEEATEQVFSDVIERGVREGVFVFAQPAFAAAVTKPMLQDWYVKRSKWRRRGISATQYADGLCAYIEAALGVTLMPQRVTNSKIRSARRQQAKVSDRALTNSRVAS